MDIFCQEQLWRNTSRLVQNGRCFSEKLFVFPRGVAKAPFFLLQTSLYSYILKIKDFNKINLKRNKLLAFFKKMLILIEIVMTY
jgi:hypothetical protein